jgi:hypothetical protein
LVKVSGGFLKVTLGCGVVAFETECTALAAVVMP